MSRRSKSASVVPFTPGPFPGTVLIPLTQGKNAIVDEVDAPTLAQWVWAFHSRGYAYRSEGPRSARRAVLMHRFLLKTPEGFDTDHINGNKLDNRRSNLRVATRSQNNVNRDVLVTNTSGYKGVRPAKRAGSWSASIVVNDSEVSLGIYASKDEAARAVDQAALKYFGAYARLNLPDQAHLPAPVSVQDQQASDQVASMRDAPEVLRHVVSLGDVGTTTAQTAEALGLPTRRVKRVLQALRSWKFVEPIDPKSYYVTYRATDAGRSYGE